MKNNNLKEISIAVVLLILLLLLLNPFHFWMPDMELGAILVSAIVAFGAFATFVLQEEVRDEREESHRAASGRAAFLAGAAFLILGIFVESFSHSVDPWLFIALVAMVISKIAVRVYTDTIR